VLLALLIVTSGSATPLALVGDGFTGPGLAIGTLAFVAALLLTYRWIGRMRFAD
jgi:hypothetical protein